MATEISKTLSANSKISLKADIEKLLNCCERIKNVVKFEKDLNGIFPWQCDVLCQQEMFIAHFLANSLAIETLPAEVRMLALGKNGEFLKKFANILELDGFYYQNLWPVTAHRENFQKFEKTYKFVIMQLTFVIEQFAFLAKENCKRNENENFIKSKEFHAQSLLNLRQLEGLLKVTKMDIQRCGYEGISWEFQTLIETLLRLTKMDAETTTALRAEAAPYVPNGNAQVYDFVAENIEDADVYKFFRATLAGQLIEMKKLLNENSSKIDLKRTHKSGKTFADFAILSGNLAVFEYFLEIEKIQEQQTYLKQFILRAAELGSLTIVKYLIEVKCLNPQIEAEDLIKAAMAGGNMALMKYLVEVQCLELQSDREFCALCESLETKNLTLIEYVVAQQQSAKNLQLNGVCDARRPLLVAAERTNLKIFKYILGLGASLSEKNGHRNVMDFAACGGNLDIMLYLKKSDAEFKLSTDHFYKFARVGTLASIKYLIEVEKLNYTKKEGAQSGTILHEAAVNRDVAVVKYFVETYNLDITARDDKRNLPFFYAVETNNLAVVRYFIEERQLSIHFKHKNNGSALHIAATNGCSEVFRYLLELHPAYLIAADNAGLTPLTLAALNGHDNIFACIPSAEITKFLFEQAAAANMNIVKFLIEKVQVDANAKDSKGETAIFYAVRANKLEVVAYLMESNKINILERNLLNQTTARVAYEMKYMTIYSYLSSKRVPYD